ncbi:MAG: hypothetical protein M3Y71_10320 [Actinomycetota bacterium]|nr:hypothetical protein [Actinomycetota bacterium]
MSTTISPKVPQPTAGQPAGPPAAAGRSRYDSPLVHRTAAVIRLSIAFVFLWAFFDKLFALGHDTGKDGKTGVTSLFGPAAWIHGGSPTNGFLSHAAGPFSGMYGSMAGAVWADWLFMLALLGIGAALALGIASRLATGAGALLLVLMWSAALPPANNVFMDDHLVYAMTLVLIAGLGAGHTWGLAAAYERLAIVRRFPILR